MTQHPATPAVPSAAPSPVLQTAPMATLGQLAALLPGCRLVGDADTPILRVHSDTRTLHTGDLFVALQGDTFDGNRFLAQARDSGAAAALCHAGAGLAATGLPGLEVADSKQALGQLATAWRAQFDLPLIAVTGSNGKTTVTQMLAAILAAFAPDAMLATQGNFNNDIGLPLTLLRLRPQHRIAAVEMGMNHPGEIALLAAMASPTVALVNNAQREHMEFMATVEAVARENGSVIAALPPHGTVVVPATDTYTPLWRGMADGRSVATFALEPEAPRAAGTQAATVWAAAPHWSDGAWQVRVHTPQGAFDCTLHIAGRHNVANALAATACALAAGVPPSAIAAGLSSFRPVKGRSRALTLQVQGRAVTLVDDSYNANPDSVAAAIAVLAALPGPRLLVLGDMGEVGDQGVQFHAEAGQQARAAGIEQLFALGALCIHVAGAFGHGARHFADMDSLIAAARTQLPSTTSVLVKGSKFMKMPLVVDALAKEGAPC